MKSRAEHRAAAILSSVLSCLVLSGCGGGGTDNPEPVDPERNPRLEFVSAQSLFLLHGETTDLRVRYLYENGEVIRGATLSYQLTGEPRGSTLEALSTVTAEDGRANVRLTSGSQDANFGVRVTPPQGAPLEFNVTVAETEVGAIVVRMSYDGDQAFTRFRPYLWTGRACGAIQPESLPLPADRAGSAASSITERPRFDNLAPRTDYVVVVVAEVGGAVQGWGCADRLAVSGRQETTANVAIADIDRALVWNGVWDLESRLDFANNLPPSVATGVRIFDELTDDQDASCNNATEDYGQDPGAFLLDFVMRWTCAWECLPGEGYGDCSELNHQTGDLSQLCLQNFQSWDGAQPRFTFGCGAWETAAEPAMDFLNEQIERYVPSFVTDVINMAGDLSRAVNNAHIFSVLTLQPMGELGMPFTHVLTEMEVRLRDWNGTVHEFRFDLDEVGFASLSAAETAGVDGRTLVLPEHRFELDYGELIRFVYVHGLLRTILGYHDTAAMLASWISCDAVADWLVGTVGILSRGTYYDACVAGLAAAGSAIEDRLGDAVDAAGHLVLAGQAVAGEVDDSNAVLTLRDGIWDGTWGEGASAGPVTGTFTGSRR